MKSLQTRRALFSIAASPVLLTGILAGTLLPGSPDESADVAVPAVAVSSLATAQQTTTVLTNALVAAVASISDAAPAGATQTEIEAGFAAVSALLPDCQSTYGLIDASGNPLDEDNLPEGKFEVGGLMQLVAGAPLVQQIVGGHLRTLVPLTSNLHPNCVTCHANYGALPPGTVVGAASFKVKL